MNVPLRYLVKILFLMETDKLNGTLRVIVDGGDWSGMFPLRIYMVPLLKMNITTVPSIIYTPTVLDWLGSKLSKEFSCTYDESGNIGKRYRRQDIIGTLFCITIDDESLLPKKVVDLYVIEIRLIRNSGYKSPIFNIYLIVSY